MSAAGGCSGHIQCGQEHGFRFQQIVIKIYWISHLPAKWQVRNFFEHKFFLICKMEMTSVAISEDYKGEHYKAPSTEYGTGGALNKP